MAIITKQPDLIFFPWNHLLHSRPHSKEAAERLPSYTKLEAASARNRSLFSQNEKDFRVNENDGAYDQAQ